MLGRAGRGLQHGDDGAWDRVVDRCDRQRDRVSQRGGEHPAVDVDEFAAPLGRRLSDDVGEPAQDLGQDHAGVAARAAQRTLGQRSGHRGHVGVLRADGRFGALARRTHREQHVRSGVSVGNGEHVEPIDLVGVGDQMVDRGVCPVAQSGSVEPTRGHLDLHPTSNA